MKELLTPEEKQYLKRVSNYLGSMGMQDGNVEIDIDNGWTFSYDDIDWNYITHFTNNYNADIPSGLIPILQKIMKYLFWLHMACCIYWVMTTKMLKMKV